MSVRGISKTYDLGNIRQFGYKTLRDQIAHLFKRDGHGVEQKSELWALRDVSFEVAEGEAIGIIGRNGSGKSTLLKILSRVTEPSAGEARLRGRVASLLEVGTGFHPELSGRENIFLAGAMLGMKREEILRAFDEIVAFSGLEKFLDTPVKRYSSGMYVRLAFAVAAHLIAEILIVDEVLAVGDAEFQRKCLGRMNVLSEGGRTVLFVSHNLNAVERLCPRAVWLDRGVVRADGETGGVVSRYVADGVARAATWRAAERGDRPAKVVGVSLRAADGGAVTEALSPREPIGIALEVDVKARTRSRLYVRITNQDGAVILSSASTDTQDQEHEAFEVGRWERTCLIPGELLAPGTYFVGLVELDEGGESHVTDDVVTFTISREGSLVDRDSRQGLISPRLAWKMNRAS